ncbi:MAG: PQQ-binding-like beta-propeller repeat protein [Actinotalea sp.]|nr:PQQ-binding-like beta-propeller repeat protein [Actinotalea sp.]
MRRPGSGAPGDSDVLEVLLVEEQTGDDYLALLHEIAVAAAALRAVSPGDPRTGEAELDAAWRAREERRDRRRRRRRVGRLVAALVVLLAVLVAVAVVDARRAAEADARLAASPAVLHRLTGPPDVRREGLPVATPGPAAPAPGEERHALPEGARAVWTQGPDGTFERGRVVVRDGGPSHPLPGPLLLPPVDDGTLPRTLVVVTPDGSRVRGVALRTGARLWSWGRDRSDPVRAAARVDGVLVLDEGSAVTALDLRSGTPLWRAAADPAVSGHGATDGQVVLLAVRDADGAPLLEARRLADGTLAWRTPLPAGTTALAVVDHRLVAC